MTSVVRSSISRSSAACTSVSLSASSDDVASSSSSSGASRRIARAIAMRWRWPPDSVTPRSPTGVSKPCGSRVDEFGRQRQLGRARDLGVGRLGPAEADVVARSRRRRSPCPAAPARCAGAASRGSASATGTPSKLTVPDSRIVEAQDQMEDRALAGARRADDRDLLARPHAERHAVEHDGVAAASDRRSARRRRRPRRARAPAAGPAAPAP